MTQQREKFGIDPEISGFVGDTHKNTICRFRLLQYVLNTKHIFRKQTKLIHKRNHR